MNAILTLFRTIECVRATSKALRIYFMLLALSISVSLLDGLPGFAQCDLANCGYYPAVYARRNIRAGSNILTASDLDVRKKQAKDSPNSVISPLELLGYKTKRDLQKDQIILYSDMDFKTPMCSSGDIRANLLLAKQLEIARRKWSSTTDLYWEMCNPSRSKEFNACGPVIVATRDIKKGALILDPTDIERVIVPQSHIFGGAIDSPFRALGAKAKYDIPCGGVIAMHELDFSTRFSDKQKKLLTDKFKLAGQKWTGLSVKEFLAKDRGVLKL